MRKNESILSRWVYQYIKYPCFTILGTSIFMHTCQGQDQKEIHL
jgi:hypothetical protein